MRYLSWALIVLAALGFVLALVLAVSSRTLLGVAPEGFSRACTNLVLLAIAVMLATKEEKGGT